MRLISLLAFPLAALALRVNDGRDPLASVAATKGPPSPVTLPSSVFQQSVVNNLNSLIDETKVRAWITRLTQFPERYYKSQNGVAATNWTLAQVQALAVPQGAKLTVSNFAHSWGVQPSVIARYESAAGGTADGGIVIVGTHIDTAGSGSGKPEPNANPAADDCASGSVVIFEALRVLTAGGFIPARPIEFHWYSGEEEGIYGSNEVAEAYAKAGTKVLSYLNLDQSGYVKPGTTPSIGIMTDYVTTAATNFVRATVKAYSTLPTVDTQCGYKCTDNAAWYDHGYNSALAFESSNADAFPYNDRVNSDGSPLDTLDVINFPHLLEFVKNTVGFVVELSLYNAGRPTTSTTTTRTTTTTTPTTTPTTTKTTTTTSTCTKTRGPQRRFGGNGGC